MSTETAPETTRFPVSRETLGRWVREAWIEWAQEQTESPPPSWLKPWEELGENWRELDRRMGEYVVQKLREQGIIKE